MCIQYIYRVYYFRENEASFETDSKLKYLENVEDYTCQFLF